MQSVLIIAHVIIVLSLITVILAQHTNSDGINSIAGSCSNSGLLSSKTTSSILTKITYVLAAMFLLNSLMLAKLASKSLETKSIIENIKIDNDQKEIPIAK